MKSRFKIGVDLPLAQELVAMMIRDIRNFPKPKPAADQTDEQALADVVKKWHRMFNARKEKYPPFVYREAVYSWMAEATSESWAPECGDIMIHCKKVMARIKDDPVRRQRMEQWKYDRAEWRAKVLTGEITE